MSKQELSRQTLLAKTAPPRPNAALVAMQIEAMQEVLRRMRATQTVKLDPITYEKLGKISGH
ncbi:MAG: hypothetical protein H6659_10885 [Ardenticatenaceae bacterium]|nr:hypothetical protein [Anaerolineales bacterium]MCB8984321.1 hypothetical protein [Ardenticatenaceae bacterium]